MPTSSTRRRWDPAAAAVALITAATAAAYVVLIHSQGNSPLPWVLAILAAAVGLTAYAAFSDARFGTASLGAGALLLAGMGFLSIFSVGLPLLVAGAIAAGSFTNRLISTMRPPGPTAARQ